jgi:hypothetical protein
MRHPHSSHTRQPLFKIGRLSLITLFFLVLLTALMIIPGKSLRNVATSSDAKTAGAPLLVFAASITVNSTAQEVTIAAPTGVNNGACTLGEAILSANANTGIGGCTLSGIGAPYTIVLSNTTYTLTSVADAYFGSNGLPQVTSQIIIQGNGATIQRSAIANTPNFRLFAVTTTGNLTLQNVTLSNGVARGGDGGGRGGGVAGQGGAIFNQGTLLVDFGALASVPVPIEHNEQFPTYHSAFDTFVPSGRSGWLKLFASSDQGILGAATNFNPNAAGDTGAFNQGHNLHKLTLTSTVSNTIPIFPPNC